MAASSAPWSIMVARDRVLRPQSAIYWYFWIGLLSDRRGHAVMLGRHHRRLLAARAAARRRPKRRIRRERDARSADGVNKSFGSLVVAADIDFDLPRGVRHALIGPNGAGKTTLINLMTGVLRARRRPHCSRAATTSPLCRPMSACGAGSCARSRSTRCFPHLTAARSRTTLAIARTARARLHPVRGR